jgi:hypothetical protein
MTKIPDETIARDMNDKRFRSQSAAETPSALDIAWAAGIFEGEGYTGLTNECSVVVISQKDPWLLLKLQRQFGGNVQNPNNGSTCYRWGIYGARARGFLMTIFTYLSPRRRIQARKALYA